MRRLTALLAGALFLAGAGSALGYDRPYPTYVALGGIFPVNSSEGLWTPMVIVDHESGERRTGLLQASLRTVTTKLDYTHQPGESIEVNYGGRVTLMAEGSGGDVYQNGRRLLEKSYAGNGAALHARLALLAENRWSVGLKGQLSRAVFGRAKKSEAGFRVPPAYSQGLLQVQVRREALLDHSGFLSFSLEAGHRRDWRTWALDNTTDRRRFSRYSVQYEDRVAWSDFSKTIWKVFAEGGRNLDLFSGGRVGGLAGIRSIAGYYRNEFRTQAHVVLNVRQEFWFEEDRMMWVWLDGGRVKRLELDYLEEDSGTRQALLGFAVGLRYDIRSLHGLPIFFNYGHGLITPKGSLESHRREFAVVVAAGF